MSLGSEKQQIRFDGHSTRLDSVVEDADTFGPNLCYKKSIQILILFGGFDFAGIYVLSQPTFGNVKLPYYKKLLQSDLFTDFPKMVLPSSEPRLDDAIEKLKNMIHNDGQSSSKVSFEFSSNPVKNLHFIILIFSSVASLDRKETF